jgi:hypothetical protein
MVQPFYSIDDSQLIYKGKGHEYGPRPFEEVRGRIVSVDKPINIENYRREDYPFN